MVLTDIGTHTRLLALVIAWSGGAAIASAQALDVTRAQGVGIGTGGATAILKSATKILQLVDAAGDQACSVTFTLQGQVTQFPSPIDVTSSTEFQDVCNEPGRIHVVRKISWCDLPHPNTIGCSERPGYCMVVRAPMTALEGSLWAHEYGHNVGLCDVSANGRVMRQSLAANNRSVTGVECDAYTQAGSEPVTCEAPERATSLQAFIRQHYFHGTPYTEARSYTGRDVPTLLGYLRNPSYAPYWSNVVLTLGIIGHPDARMPLVRFVESRSRRLSRSELIARQSAVVALGYLYLHTRDDRILAYLTSGIYAEEWRTRLRMPVAKVASDAHSVEEQLAISSIQALGLTGSPQAAEALTVRLTKQSDSTIRGVVKDALDLIPRVAASGESVFTAIEKAR